MSLLAKVNYSINNLLIVRGIVYGHEVGKQILEPIPSENRNIIQNVFSRLLPNRYHGTSMKLLGKKQLKEREFEVMDSRPRIYFDNLETATEYALRNAKYDRSTPIVLKIASDQKSQWNEISLEGHGFCGKGLYRFYDSTKAPVKIIAAYSVNPLSE